MFMELGDLSWFGDLKTNNMFQGRSRAGSKGLEMGQNIDLSLYLVKILTYQGNRFLEKHSLSNKHYHTSSKENESYKTLPFRFCT